MSAIALDDSPQTVEMLRTMTRLWAGIRQMPQSQRSLVLAAVAACSDELYDVLQRMLSIVENAQSTPAERERVMATIADALFQSPNEDTQQAMFAVRLRALMEAKGISQQELAERIGCTQPAISQMLNRSCRPQKKTILKLAEALTVNPRELWPDLHVAEMLDAVAIFEQDGYVMTDAEATALRDTSKRNLPTIPARSLPKRRR